MKDVREHVRLGAFAAARRNCRRYGRASRSGAGARVASLLVVTSCMLSAGDAEAELIPSADGLTVYDTVMRVTWLSNANLPATEKFGVSGINPDGSMNFATALLWVGALNAMNGGAGYLGHNNW